MLAQHQGHSEPDRFIGLPNGADMLGVNERTLRRLIASGDLPAYRLGKKVIRLRESDVLALLSRIPTAEASQVSPPTLARQAAPGVSTSPTLAIEESIRPTKAASGSNLPHTPAAHNS